MFFFATTVLLALATHFLHLGDYIIEPLEPGADTGRGSCARGGLHTTFVVSTFVACPRRFQRPRVGWWSAGIMLITLGSWWLLISN